MTTIAEDLIRACNHATLRMQVTTLACDLLTASIRASLAAPDHARAGNMGVAVRCNAESDVLADVSRRVLGLVSPEPVG